MKDRQSLFNVLECVKHLREVGFTQEQAEAQAQEIEKAKNDLESHLATKKDLKRDLKELEERLALKMVITSGGFAFAMLGALVTLAKFGLLTPPS